VATFKIGINMAGAISAGAYTAGVLDFLVEALDEWYAAKANGEEVPMHDVSIEVLSGASAGGMCAAISAVMLQESFDHVREIGQQQSTNQLYESWVNRIDITELLKTDDLKSGGHVASLLDSTIIEQIATYALTPKNLLTKPRLYVSPNLTLFLSLTNLRGVPYSLNSAAPGSIEEGTFFYGDRIRFETTRGPGGSLLAESAWGLNVALPGQLGGSDVLQTAAMATGAFPIFLAPRTLDRYTREYIPPLWESVTSAASGTPPPVPPNFPADFSQPFLTLNVDGGVTNNDPFNYASDFLGLRSPVPNQGDNSQEPLTTDRAVITVAPFPTTDQFNPVFQPEKASSIFSVLPQLFSALISQSRFFGESLSGIMQGTSFSRFVIAPSDSELSQMHLSKGDSLYDQPPALQCASLGAFGGFFERGFRDHDYQLGRRNCQQFLSRSFVLPAGNTIIKSGLDALEPTVRARVESKFKRPAPGTYGQTAEMLRGADASLPEGQEEAGDLWIPIIPLCTESLSREIPRAERAQISSDKLHAIVTLVLKRYQAIIPHFIASIPSPWFRFFLRIGQPAIRYFVRRPLTDALIKQLGDSYKR
jgi:predicted acylesterase/phospholipase RssA